MKIINLINLIHNCNLTTIVLKLLNVTIIFGREHI